MDGPDIYRDLKPAQNTVFAIKHQTIIDSTYILSILEESGM
jgi:hypothetical protein